MRLAAQRLEECLQRRPVLMGIGSRWQGDDAAGPAVIARVAGRIQATCIDAGDAPERHLGEARGAGSDTILLLDAVDFGGSPGEITILRAEELPARVGTTHNPSLGLLMRYLEAESGAQVLLLGIQPASIGFGKPISAPVLASVEALARMLEARLGATPEANDMEPAAGPRHAGNREGGQHR